MGMNFNIEVNNENEFNQQVQMYLAQGYNLQSNFNGMAILKKKSYSVALLIILIILFFPAAIIYYLVSDNIVTIIQNSNNQSFNNVSNNTAEEYVSYCPNCGHGLYSESKFCPGCGNDLSAEEDEKIVEEVEDE